MGRKGNGVRSFRRYVNTLNDMFRMTTAVQISSSSVSITMSLFSIVAVGRQSDRRVINDWDFAQHDWGSGYGFVLYAVAQIQILCYLGTVIATEVIASMIAH